MILLHFVRLSSEHIPSFTYTCKLPNVNTFTEVELLNLFASYQTVYFTVSEKEKLISNISVNVSGEQLLERTNSSK